MAFNWGQGIIGAGAGALSGAGGGLPGMIAGGVLGGGMGGFGGSQGGNQGGDQFGLSKMPTMTGDQQGILNNILQQLGQGGQLGQGYGQALGGLQDFMDPSSEAMQRFADPYMRQFNQQTVPGLAERFAGAGATGGALSSSGFGQALGGAGAGLQEQLASMKTGLQRQSMGDIMNQYGGMSQQALGARPFGYAEQSKDFITQLITDYLSRGAPGAKQGFNFLSNKLFPQQGAATSQGFTGAGGR